MTISTKFGTFRYKNEVAKNRHFGMKPLSTLQSRVFYLSIQYYNTNKRNILRQYDAYLYKATP